MLTTFLNTLGALLALCLCIYLLGLKHGQVSMLLGIFLLFGIARLVRENNRKL